jgi:hypothetical protein
MYTATGPAAGVQDRRRARGTSAGLVLARHRALPPRPYPDHFREYFQDLFGTYGLAFDEAAFGRGRTSFTELVAALLPELGDRLDRFDLAVLASVTPDAEPTFPMCYLQHAVPEPGLAFAIADQGVAGPFTALRMAVDRVRAGTAQRALVFVLDQAAVLHDGDVPERLRARTDAGVLLVLEADGAFGGVEVLDRCRVELGEVASRWAEIVREACADAGSPVSVVVGPELHDRVADLPRQVETVPVPLGSPATGIWAAFADRLPAWRAAGRRVVLADYDPEGSRLDACVIDVVSEPDVAPEPGEVRP